jgi:hypothetical protein
MRIEASNLLNLYFEDIGKDRYFMGDIWSSPNSFSLSLPPIVFPKGEEDNIKNKIIDLFGADDFNQNYSLDISISVLEDAQTIWGLVNNHGQIFSLYSMYDLNSSINNNIYSYMDKLESEYPDISNYSTRENILNAIVSFYLIENLDNPMAEVCQNYYRKILLNDELSKNLNNDNTEKPKTKI